MGGRDREGRYPETPLMPHALLAHSQSDNAGRAGTPYRIILQGRRGAAAFADRRHEGLAAFAFEGFAGHIEAAQIGTGSRRTGGTRLAARARRADFTAHSLRSGWPL